MVVSMRLYPNIFNGGEACTLYVEGLSDPKAVVNKKCTVRLYEMDTIGGKGEKPGPKDLMAEFETVIVPGSKKNVYFFDEEKTKRTDQFSNALPAPEYQNDAAGNLLPEPLKWKPAYFDFALDFGAIRPAKFYCILMQGSPKELEYYSYEISFSVEIEGKEIFNSYKMQGIVDCNDIVVENCVNAAKFFKENHDAMIVNRNAGTHFGNRYKYILPNEDSYLQEVQRELNLTNEDIELLRGQDWKDAEKRKFDDDKKRYSLKETSCIDYVLDCFEIGHKKAGMEADWKKIVSKVVDKIGQSLAKALVEHNWVAVYYNPDVKNPWDKQKLHTDSFHQAATKKTYGSNIVVPVFDLVVNYAPQTTFGDKTPVEFPTIIEADQITKLLNVPFAFLMSRDSIHTAMLIKGKVYEVHWDIGPYVQNGNMVISNKRDFLFKGGHEDTTWEWQSGLAVMPRLFWPEATYTP